MTLHDSELKALVSEALFYEPGLTDAGIGVAVDGGAVLLSGQVDSYPEKLLAEKVALRVRGVNVLDVTITVAGASLQETDIDIAIAAQKALERSVNIPADCIHVVVHDHIVTLSGTVQWNFEREAAKRAVAHLKGVSHVVEMIQVRPPAPPAETAASVYAALSRNARLATRPITVSVRGSAVCLEGVVQSWQENREANDAAWSAGGVTSVDNQLRTHVFGDEPLMALHGRDFQP